MLEQAAAPCKEGLARRAESSPKQPKAVTVHRSSPHPRLRLARQAREEEGALHSRLATLEAQLLAAQQKAAAREASAREHARAELSATRAMGAAMADFESAFLAQMARLDERCTSCTDKASRLQQLTQQLAEARRERAITQGMSKLRVPS